MHTNPRTALVTGATSGIGAAIASRLGEQAHVIVAGRDRDRGRGVVAVIKGSGGSAEFLHLELDAEPERVRAALASISRGVDILVNNAAAYPVGPTEGLTDVDAFRMLRVNVLAPHVLVSTLAPMMAARGGGVIIGIGSWMGRVGTPSGAMYSATKAAGEQLVRSWAAEYGPRGVRVNAIAPGVTLTEGNQRHEEVLLTIASTTPARTLVRPRDVADAVSYLASEGARMVHGVTLAVDGGIGVTRA